MTAEAASTAMSTAMSTVAVSLLHVGTGELALRVLLSVALGGVIGAERELDAQQAGFRTHIMVCLGATLFGMISASAFAPFQASRNSNNVQIDPTRVASQVVVGVGFLGAGVIFREGASVRGVTTAASMWVTAAIGLAVGLGFYAPALIVTAVTVLALVGFRGLGSVIRRFSRQRETAHFRLASDGDPAALVAALHDLRGVSVRSLEIDRSRDEVVVVAGLKADVGVRLGRLLTGLADRPDVLELSLDEP